MKKRCCILWMVGLCFFASCASTVWQGGIHAKMAWSKKVGLRVVYVEPAGPAAKAGLRVGDPIVRLDGALVRELSTEELTERFTGPVGSHIRVQVLRDGKPMEFRIERVPYRKE